MTIVTKKCFFQASLNHFKLYDFYFQPYPNFDLCVLQVGDLKCVEAIDKTEKIDWNERNNLGDTPVMTALRKDKKKVIKFLLSHPKVDKSRGLRNAKGQTLFFLVKQKNDKDLMNFFPDHSLNEKMTTSYIHIRDKIIETIPDNVVIIQKYIEEFNERKLSKHTIRRRRGQYIQTVTDLLNELENNMIICMEKGKVMLKELLKLVQFVADDHPSIISQELVNEVEEFCDFFEKSYHFVVFIEVGPGTKHHGVDLRRKAGCDYPYVNCAEDQESILDIQFI